MVEQIVIVGGGGHGRETADILRAAIAAGRRASLIGYVDDGKSPGDMVGDLTVVGDLRWLIAQPRHYRAVVAFGAPKTTARIASELRSAGVRFTSAIDPTARISPLATVATGVILFPQAVVNVGATLGEHVTLNIGASVSHDSRIGECSNLNPGARIAGNVVVGKGAYIGMGANVLQALSVGDWVTVGAGAVVIRDLESYVTAVGVPAKVTKRASPQESS